MYNFMGIILEAQGVFNFFAFMHSFPKLVSDFPVISNPIR